MRVRRPSEPLECAGSKYQDTDGSLWAAMWDGSILQFKDGRLHQNESLSSRIGRRIFAIRRDRAGDMWFGGEQGLHRLHEGILTHFTVHNGLPGNVVNVIEEGRAGKLWIGTNSGLVQYVGGKLAPVEALRGNSIEALYQDEAGVWWIGTLGDGLYRTAGGPKGLKVTRYTTADGLHSNRAYSILEDNFGYLWMSSDLGFSRIRKQQLNDLAAGRGAQVIPTHFGASDGLPGECSSGGQKRSVGLDCPRWGRGSRVRHNLLAIVKTTIKRFGVSYERNDNESIV